MLLKNDRKLIEKERYIYWKKDVQKSKLCSKLYRRLSIYISTEKNSTKFRRSKGNESKKRERRWSLEPFSFYWKQCQLKISSKDRTLELFLPKTIAIGEKIRRSKMCQNHSFGKDSTNSALNKVKSERRTVKMMRVIYFFRHMLNERTHLEGRKGRCWCGLNYSLINMD